MSLLELAAVRGPLGLALECDLYFAPTRAIAAYAELAREHRRIVTRHGSSAAGLRVGGLISIRSMPLRVS